MTNKLQPFKLQHWRINYAWRTEKQRKPPAGNADGFQKPTQRG